MTEKKAAQLIQNKLTCMTLADRCAIGKGCFFNCFYCELNYMQGTRGEQEESLIIAIDALVKIHLYRKLGTLEELRALKEKQIPKKPVLDGIYHCPSCKKGMLQGSMESKGNCCKNCGQVLDWKKLNGTD